MPLVILDAAFKKNKKQKHCNRSNEAVLDTHTPKKQKNNDHIACVPTFSVDASTISHITMNQPNKPAIHNALQNQLEAKKQQLERHLEDLKAAAASDTKSSAGDKYETSREMIRQEMDKAMAMLSEYELQLEKVKALNPIEVYHSVQPGSLVHTDKASFYISVGFGKLMENGQAVFVISPQAPLARLLLGKQAGEMAEFNGMTYAIHTVS